LFDDANSENAQLHIAYKALLINTLEASRAPNASRDFVRECNDIIKAQAERIRVLEQNIDVPECDGTDAAHPAWWRGHEQAVASLCQLINQILDGKKRGNGIASEPWESTRNRLHDLFISVNKIHDSLSNRPPKPIPPTPRILREF
jgi:hypothetical protein